ncbi:MAG: cbb3-type cytochrome oxidase assembly protein CcoS [Sulfurimicrobium sp.]|nr:cbb3-type cytochrome oxidase assembly protein CcoS [Sulfurimicrobium sp.]
MEILYLLIPLSVALIFLIVWIFLWAVKSGQFDDMEGPAHRILMDDDRPQSKSAPKSDTPIE